MSILTLLQLGQASAQSTCTTRTDCVDNNLPYSDREPGVNILVPFDTVTSAQQRVVFTFGDDYALDPASVIYTVPGGTWAVAPVWKWNKTYTSAMAEGTVNLSPGSNTLSVTVCDQGSRCTTSSAAIYYKAPAPGGTRAVPAINTSVHRVDSRNLATCDGCSETVMTYSLPSYKSVDQEHTVTLFYSTHQANPRGFVELEVADAGSDPAASMTLQVRDASGVYMTLDNGATVQHYRTGAGTNRIAASWAAANLSTGMYDYTVIVRSYWPDNATKESSVVVKVPIVNERSSPFGAGVTIAGHERIYPRADGALVTDGAGGVQWFTKVSCDAGNICTYKSPPGDQSSLVGMNGYWNRHYEDGGFAEYWGTGRISFRMNRFGWRTTYHYDASFTRLEGISDLVNLRTNLAYTPGGMLASFTDPFARQSVVSHTGTDWVSVDAPNATRVLTMSYDASHRLQGWTDARGGVTNVTYDAASGKMSSVQGPVLSDGVTSARPTVGVRSREATLLPLAGTGTASVLARRVTADSVQSSVTSPLGDVTRVRVDPFGGATRIAGPRDTTWIGRNARGQITSVSDGEGNSSTFTYQTTFPHRMTIAHQNGPDGDSEVRYSYGVYGSVSQLRVVRGPVYDFVLDGLGRATTTKRNNAVIGTATFDSGRYLTQTDAAGHTTTYQYAAGPTHNLATVTSGGTTTELRYDGMGRLVQTVTGGVASDSVGYDLLNRATYSRDALGGVTQMGFAGNGVDLGELIDPLNQSYQWVHNTSGLVTQEIDPAGLSTGYTYHPASGLLKTLTNRRAQAVGFTYDAEGRLATRTADGATTTWSYDPDRRWEAVETPASRDTIRYHTDGKVAESVTWRDGRRYSIRRTYTDRNQQDSVVVTGPWGTRSYVYTHDDQGRLDGLRDYAGKWTRMYLNAEGLPDSARVPTTAGMRMSFSFTPRHQLESVTTNGPSALPHRYVYTNRGLVKADTFGTGTTWNGHHYTYDGLDRLDSWTYHKYRNELDCSGGHGCQFLVRREMLNEQPFEWDSVGNPKGSPLSLGNRLRGYLNYSMNYDADGNLIRKYNASGFDQTLTWNSLGQLTGVARVGAATVTYGYDGYGRRAKRTDSSTGAVTHFIYDGDDLALEVDGAGNLLREYTYYPGIDQPHGMRQWAGGAGGTNYYYVLQQPGHVQGLVNDAGQLVNEYRYSPFGDPVSGYPVQGTTNPLQYMAREVDATTGMYYVRNRWYDPQMGRFISEDPIGLAGGLNQYSYVGNAPTMMRDPLGLICTGPMTSSGYPSGRTYVGGQWECIHPWQLDLLLATLASSGSNSSERVMGISGGAGAGPSGPGGPNAPGGGPTKDKTFLQCLGDANELAKTQAAEWALVIVGGVAILAEESVQPLSRVATHLKDLGLSGRPFWLWKAGNWAAWGSRGAAATSGVALGAAKVIGVGLMAFEATAGVLCAANNHYYTYQP